MTVEQHKQNDTNHMIEIAKIDRYQFRQKWNRMSNEMIVIYFSLKLTLLYLKIDKSELLSQ